VRTPVLSSLLLASADPDRLRVWYRDALGVRPDPDGFLHFGPVGVLLDGRDDVAARAAEPGRVVLNYEVSDIRARARHLDGLGVAWVSPVEYREDGGAWFGTVADPDGNYVQLIQLTPDYWAQRRARHERSGGHATLLDATCAVRLPAQDLGRARRFYADKLGLEPAESREGGLSYECGGTSFVLYQSQGRASGDHTQMGFYVADIESTVTELRERGVRFMDVDAPGMRTEDGIADIQGQYPSTGAIGERAAWFHDSEGNLLGVAQLVMSESSSAGDG
jgi:catechol 2,3-dioxygenase-like lactoylglutathione lyase family enzyme